MPRRCLIAQSTELIAQRQRHVVIAAGPEADIAAHPCGQQAGEDGKLAAGGGLAPAGLVVVAEHEALVGQAVQGGGQLLRDEPGREGLCRQQDQVLACEHAGILVLAGGSTGGHITVQRGQRAVAGGLGQRGKVDVQHIVVVVHRRGFRFRVGLRQGLQRRRGHAGDGVGQLQPQSGVQTEAGDGTVGVEIVGEQRGAGAEAADGVSAAQRQQGQQRQHQQAAASHGCLRYDAAAQDNGQHRRHQRQEDEGQAGQHHIGDGAGEVAHHVTGHGDHERQGKVGLEVALAAILHADADGPQQRQDQRGPAGDPAAGQSIGQQADEQAQTQRGQGGRRQRRVEKDSAAVESAQQQLVVQQGQREKEPAQRMAGGRRCLRLRRSIRLGGGGALHTVRHLTSGR